MIDAKELVKRHEAANANLASLQEDESAVLQHYCSMITDEFLKAVASGKAPLDQIIINAMRTGITLGLAISIQDGEVLGRGPYAGMSTTNPRNA
ncbi:MAG: hypothetical protein Q8R28_09005 [Dehalococcoidia bacterium]|nr:hypothetical protein [Dehalococcoidia bacterium]